MEEGSVSRSMMTSVAAATLLIGVSTAVPAGAQDRPGGAREDCKLVFCSPELRLQPGLILSNLVGSPETALADGSVVRWGRETELLARFALVVPTALPRISVLALVQWTPFAEPLEVSLTEEGADRLVVGAADANHPALAYGAAFQLLRPERTGGWLGASASVLGLFSPAERRDDRRSYTHKLMPQLGMDLGILTWLPSGHVLRNLSLYGVVDYVATGRGRAGDPVPGGGSRLTDADPWVFIAGLQFPIVPSPVVR
jgi:hypothetical protein